MKSVCKTKWGTPSMSLIKSICYPGKLQLWLWDVSMRKLLQIFCKKMLENYLDFYIKECGLFLNPKYRFLGTYPDAKHFVIAVRISLERVKFHDEIGHKICFTISYTLFQVWLGPNIALVWPKHGIDMLPKIRHFMDMLLR